MGLGSESESTFVHLFAPVANTHRGQTSAVLLEVADLDKRRPQLYGRTDHVDHITNDSQKVLVEEVGLESVERLGEVRGEQAERVGALGRRRTRNGRQRPVVEAGDLLEDLLRVRGRHLARVVEGDAEGYSAYVPELPTILVTGTSIDDLTARAKDAIRLFLETLNAERPPASTVREIEVELPAYLS